MQAEIDLINQSGSSTEIDELSQQILTLQSNIQVQNEMIATYQTQLNSGYIVDNDNDDDGVCDTDEIIGCTDPLACNYMEFATDSGDCIYSIDISDCATCSGETDGTGTILFEPCSYCNVDYIEGCTDPLACNYNNMALIDEDCSIGTDYSLCTYALECESCSGETDGTGTIVNNDSDSDGVCDELEVLGCTDALACNYDETATDSGDCSYPAEDYLDCDGSCIMDSDSDGVCDELEVLGCTDASACNYDETATDDDGSCSYPLETYLDCAEACLNDSDSDGVCDELEVLGCTDASACNYDETATDSGVCSYPAEEYLDCDGQCISDINNDDICDDFIPGCVNNMANNYNSLATFDDGSCLFSLNHYDSITDAYSNLNFQYDSNIN